jgi:hypothetical protein
MLFAGDQRLLSGTIPLYTTYRGKPVFTNSMKTLTTINDFIASDDKATTFKTEICLNVMTREIEPVYVNIKRLHNGRISLSFRGMTYFTNKTVG